MNTKLNTWILAISTLATAGSALAASDSSTLSVGASVNNTCAIGRGHLDFGDVSLLVTSGAGIRSSMAAKQAFQTVPVICTNGATATVTGDLGLYASGSLRQMASGSDRLTYQLYADSALTTVLDTTTGSIPYTGNGNVQTVTIYGRVLAADMISAKKGGYEDTVALTITYTP